MKTATAHTQKKLFNLLNRICQSENKAHVGSSGRSGGIHAACAGHACNHTHLFHFYHLLQWEKFCYKTQPKHRDKIQVILNKAGSVPLASSARVFRCVSGKGKAGEGLGGGRRTRRSSGSWLHFPAPHQKKPWGCTLQAGGKSHPADPTRTH